MGHGDCVPGLVREQALRSPDRVAVEWCDGRLTYAELVGRANQLAHLLRQIGVGTEVPVGILLPRSPEMVVSLLAILQAGGAYVPLDPADAAARQRSMLVDAGCTVLVTAGPAPAPELATLPGLRVVDLDSVRAQVDLLPDTPPEAGPAGGQIAYIMYTSGSTGRPKGVAVSHHSIVNLVRNEYVRFAGQSFCALAPLAFDASTFEIWGALGNGARLVIPPPGLLDPDQIGQLVTRYGVTVLFLTKGLFDVTIEARPAGLSGLRELLTGGEAMSPSHVRQALSLLPTTAVRNCYGPTEATTFTTVGPALAPADIEDSVPIGPPIAGVRVRVLDPELRIVPAGTPGELYIGGAGLARGYTDPAATAERFVPDPYADTPGDRLYRTGDLVVQRPDRTLVFLGRLDNQLKIRGHRVEPAEAEHVLSRYPGIRQVCCVPARDPGGTVRLAAYLVADELSLADLSRYATEHLPAYLRPARWRQVPQLPLTRNGKIDRAALSSTLDDGGDEPAAGTAVSDLTPSEAYLCALWQEVLGHRAVGRTDDFIALGGHSLMAMRAAVRIRRDTGKRIEVVEFFRRGSLAELATLLDQTEPEADGESAVPRRSAGPTAPLSPFQHGMWVLHQIYPDCSAYNVPLAHEIDGPLDIDALRSALNALVDRHEALRTSIGFDGGAPVQRIAASPAAGGPQVELALVDLRPVPALERAGALRAEMAAAVRRPFDLTVAPLWRVTLYALGPTRHCLFLVVHHLVTDGWSMELIKRDLSVAYRAARLGAAPPGPELAVQFADLAEWAVGAASRERTRRELAYWRQQLAVQRPPLRLPGYRHRATAATFDGDAVRGETDEPTTRMLRASAGAAGVSLFSLMLSVFSLVLSRYAGQSSFHIGFPLAVRDQPESQDVVGFFNNTLVLSCDLADSQTVLDLMHRTHERVVGALAHPHVPFETLVSELAADRRPGRNPYFDVWFNLLSYPSHPMDIDGARVREVRPPLAGALFDLSVYVRDTGATITVDVVYNRDAFPPDRITVLLAQYLAALEACRTPDRPLSALRLAAGPPRDRAGFRPPAAGSIVNRLRGRAGDRPAVERDGGVLRYQDLVRRIEQTAERLAMHGVGPGHAVALLADRTEDDIVGVLATRQAGAAFALLDLRLPSRRLAYMLRTVRPRAVLVGPAARLPDEVVAALDDIRPALVDRPGVGLAERSAAGPDGARVLPAGTAYLMFTSGSTGRPLAVVGAEAPLTTFFDWYAERFDLGSADRFSVLAGLSHDPLLREILLPLSLGGTVCLPDADVLGSPPQTLRWLVDRRITVVHLTPAMARMIAATASGNAVDLPNVRLVALGGAAISRSTYAAVRDLFPRARRIGLYGTTETPQGISVVDLDAEFTGDGPLWPPLGTGSPSADLVVLRDGRSEAAVNELGEVVVRSPYLALGYLDEPQLTAHRFRPDPTGGSDAPVFRTGDLGRYRPDGAVEFVGRVDDQVSVNGHRVELAEVEAAARDHPAVSDAAAAFEQRRIVLAAVPRPPGVDIANLRRHLAGFLPPPMMPDEIVIAPAIPLTANGKVDRDRVAALAPQPSRIGEVPPIGTAGLLEPIRSIWSTVLDVDDIDPDTSFFQLGGDSFGLLRVHRLVRQQLSPDVNLVDLFRYPTVRQLAVRLAGAPADPMTPGRAGRRPVLPVAREARANARDLARRAVSGRE